LQDSIHDEFLERLLDMAGQARIGDPMNPETQVGPITTEPQYRKIMDYIEIAKGEGAVCVMGGDSAPAPDGNKGLFVQPTVFSGVTNDMRIAQEEVFGPVLSVLRFTDEEHAIEIANDIKYGLAAGIWTQNLKRAITVSDRLEAGTVWVNTYRSTSYTTPFGGYKASGLGRENGMEAIKEYLQTKSIWLSTGSSVANPYMRR
ncbi:MAG: aldehyde dehydrogenase family protein, partial [Rhodospirillaceae bacterium]|nr:aldehyde dehydrogenase family protein [Rhodospirillaceae bacterium]